MRLVFGCIYGGCDRLVISAVLYPREARLRATKDCICIEWSEYASDRWRITGDYHFISTILFTSKAIISCRYQMIRFAFALFNALSLQ